MTRANINFIYQNIGESPKCLYYYQNGDQYPRGIRDFYHVLDFTNGEWSIKSFKKWLGENYKETKSVTYMNKKTGIGFTSNYEPTEIPAKPRKIDHPCIYYDDAGYITDYTYVFDSSIDNKVMVYEWDKQIFEGNATEFENWIKKQE